MSTSGAAGSGLVSVTKHVTGAQIATSFSAPVQVVAAPAVGEAIWLSELYAEFVAGVVTYDAATFSIYYGAGVPATATRAVTNLADLVQQGAPPVSVIGAEIGSDDIKPRTVVNGAGLYLGTQTADPARIGPIVTATVDAGGAGYVVNDTGTLDSNLYGAAATYRVSAVGGGGAVTAFVVTAPGDGSKNGETGNTTTDAGAQPGVGVGFTFNVTNVSPADGDLYLTAIYAVKTLH